MSDQGQQQQQQSNGEFIGTLPEPLRAHGAFKDIKDVGTLAQKYADTQRPFTERLPEKYRNDPSFRDIKDDEGLYSSFSNAQKMVGADKARLALVPKDAKDEAGWDGFYKAVGRPEAADKYAFGKRADGSDYSAADADFQKQIAPILYKMGVSQAQLDRGRPEWDVLQGKIATLASDASKAEMAKTVTALREKWGGDYDGHVKNAEAAVQYYAKKAGVGDALAKELSATGLGNNPALAQVFAMMGAQLKEDGLFGKGEGGFADRPSMENAKKQIAEKEQAFRDNKSFRDKNAPGRQEALDEIARLYEAAYPEQEGEQKLAPRVR
jgi:hypothetical protein